MFLPGLVADQPDIRCEATRNWFSRRTGERRVRSSADPVEALGLGVGLSTLSGGVGREFDDEVSVEGGADSL
jgi:hypothetical protein